MFGTSSVFLIPLASLKAREKSAAPGLFCILAALIDVCSLFRELSLFAPVVFSVFFLIFKIGHDNGNDNDHYRYKNGLDVSSTSGKPVFSRRISGGMSRVWGGGWGAQCSLAREPGWGKSGDMRLRFES